MKKHLTSDKWKFLFLFLAILTFAEISMTPKGNNYELVVLNVVFWLCFTWLVVTEQNNKASD